jgi:PAS domain S-box-containing protein
MSIRADDLLQVTLLGEALEYLDVAVLVADESGGRVAVNQAACELTGYKRDELLALPTEDLTGRAPRDHERKLLDFARHGRAPGRMPLRRKDGSVVDVEYRWLPTRVAGMDYHLFLIAPSGTDVFAGLRRKKRDADADALSR